ncbi:hypothetical protein M0208_03360 [Sphingomonas sp. SUN019]|uniref:tetratricopeptide repeat protein n=1 Tax=Sphingomonas sp. SUN019 TaxID=2937788 RepID=UPI002164CB08|nr:tetratricopeptide repeat protein [Sphingomonas sp. SUN019]UVO49595.1 hypothetical protein M0208_03360 [Sphingomonas sp. SUN019]
MKNVKDLIRSGDYDAALAVVEPELTGPSRKVALTHKMRILMRSDRPNAGDTIRELLAEGEPTAEAHANLAAVMMMHRKYNEAVEEGRRALSIDPAAVAARKRVISTLQRLRRDPEALEVVNAGIAQHPDDDSFVELRTQIEAKLAPAAASETPIAETAPEPEPQPDLPKRKKKKFMRSFGKR